MSSSLLSSDEVRSTKTLQYSTSYAGSMVNRANYSRHLSLRHGTRSSGRKSARVIHVSIRSPKHKRCQEENQFKHHSALELRSMSSGLRSIDNCDHLKEAAVIHNTASASQKTTDSLRSKGTPQFHRLLSLSSQSSYPQEDKQDKRDIVLQKNHSSANSIKTLTKHNSALFRSSNETMTQVNWSSNTKDLLENSGKRNKKNKRSNGPSRRCKCLLVFLIIALLVGAAIAAALAITLTKSDATTTISTSSETTTTTTTISETTTTTTTIIETTTATTTTITETTTTTAIIETTTTTMTTIMEITSTTTTDVDSTTSTALITTFSTTIIVTPTTTTSTIALSTTITETSSTTMISTTRTTTTTGTTATTTTTTSALNMAYGSPSSSVSNYGGTETLKLNCTTTLKNLTLQIFVLRTYGATYNGAYGTYWGGTVNVAYTTNSTYIIYTWSIVSGQVITCSGGPYTFTAQFNSNGTTQITSGDTYIMTTTTSSGIINTYSGHF